MEAVTKKTHEATGFRGLFSSCKLKPECRNPFYQMEFRSWFVVVVVVFYVPTVLQYSTVLLCMCSKQKHKANHGHKKGHAPREL